MWFPFWFFFSLRKTLSRGKGFCRPVQWHYCRYVIRKPCRKMWNFINVSLANGFVELASMVRHDQQSERAFETLRGRIRRLSERGAVESISEKWNRWEWNEGPSTNTRGIVASDGRHEAAAAIGVGHCRRLPGGVSSRLRTLHVLRQTWNGASRVRILNVSSWTEDLKKTVKDWNFHIASS